MSELRHTLSDTYFIVTETEIPAELLLRNVRNHPPMCHQGFVTKTSKGCLKMTIFVIVIQEHNSVVDVSYAF